MRQHWRWAVAGVVVAAVAFLDVSLIAQKQHTKTVTHTKVVTHQVTRTVTKNARFAGTPVSLAAFLHAQSASRSKCPPSFKAGVACYQFGGRKFFVFLAVPAAS